MSCVVRTIFLRHVLLRQAFVWHGLLTLVTALVLLSARAEAAVTIDWAPVGNTGNAADPTTGSLYGAVGYAYSIAKQHVTIGQYTDFLNAVAADDTYSLYNPAMGTNLNIAGIARSGSPGSYAYSVIGSANHPVTYVNFGDAARFANWLGNGQPVGVQGPGTTETGAYTLNGAVTSADLAAVTRNANATIVIPSEDEWYKAAYYDSAANTYYQFPFSTDALPTSALPGNTPNTANFGDATTGYAVTGSTILDPNQNYLTDVGSYTASLSPYDVWDMGGIVGQWNETSVRGGAWSGNVESMRSSTRAQGSKTFEFYQVGFRVAAVPEPTTAMLAAAGALSIFVLRRRFR